MIHSSILLVRTCLIATIFCFECSPMRLMDLAIHKKIHLEYKCVQLLDDSRLFLPVLCPFLHCVAWMNKGFGLGIDNFGVHSTSLCRRRDVQDVRCRLHHLCFYKALINVKELSHQRFHLLETWSYAENHVCFGIDEIARLVFFKHTLPLQPNGIGCCC